MPKSQPEQTDKNNPSTDIEVSQLKNEQKSHHLQPLLTIPKIYQLCHMIPCQQENLENVTDEAMDSKNLQRVPNES